MDLECTKLGNLRGDTDSGLTRMTVWEYLRVALQWSKWLRVGSLGQGSERRLNVGVFGLHVMVGGVGTNEITQRRE